MTGTIGGSGFLDYVFIRAIALKFGLKKYLEIGTYIGESLKCVSDICEVCHSVTAPKGSVASLTGWLKSMNQPDFTDRLAQDENVVHHYCEDSKTFDYSNIKDDIDLYFIDADNDYVGVYWDTKNVFSHRKADSFVIWHDIKGGDGLRGGVVAIKHVLKEEFKNVFCVDNNLCGIYIPPKYQKAFALHTWEYKTEDEPLYVYETLIRVKSIL